MTYTHFLIVTPWLGVWPRFCAGIDVINSCICPKSQGLFLRSMVVDKIQFLEVIALRPPIVPATGAPYKTGSFLLKANESASLLFVIPPFKGSSDEVRPTWDNLPRD